MTLSPHVAAIVATLEPGCAMPHSEHCDPEDAQPCPHCNALIWSVTVEQACARPGEGYPLLLNHQPTAWGRYEIVEPGVARWCPLIRLREWPLPRYSSHLIDCPVLIAKRIEEAEIRAEQMRYAAADRKAAKARKQRQLDAYHARFEGVDPFGKEL